jgi:hypothetical protein
MAVQKVGEKYRCNIYHNEVTVTKAGGGSPVCGGAAWLKLMKKSRSRG